MAKTPQGKIFDSSLDKGKPYDIRVGAGQVCTQDGLGLTAVHWMQSLPLACVLKAACAFQRSLAGAPPSPCPGQWSFLRLPGADTKSCHLHLGALLQVIAGLDEGLGSMKVGGVRRLYIPGNLAFPKGLASGPGRPRVPPKTPVVFDVELVYVPGKNLQAMAASAACPCCFWPGWSGLHTCTCPSDSSTKCQCCDAVSRGQIALCSRPLPAASAGHDLPCLSALQA